MKDNRVYLLQMLDFIGKIESYTQGGRDEFMASQMIQDAVIRNFETIGEAVKQVSNQVKAEHPEIPWRNIAGFRDILIHRYMGVDLEAVWNVVVSEIPALKSVIIDILSDEHSIDM
ncbi:HepT-like ribonuclease domain-containing protein [Methanospirillum lacunae]|uniref:DUF86 domain-containing protein n=1 Tax=Methanospirillum lacunae TaxID=668570 RepID=A0A2V2MWC3_9EURY|nr:DUF86 domain-containing protein [Methanospirillum lacunae]PWR69706.1 DUF86 domain-containing protein [Methanospirillum lacunae]